MGSLATLVSVGRLHIVAIAALGAYTFGWLFLGERPWLLALLTAVDWFVVNLTNRVVDLPEDGANQIRGTSFVEKHRRALSAAAFATLILSLVIGHLVLPHVTALRIGFHALGLAYNFPLFPKRRRIKQLYFFKNVASATGFMLTVFGFPLAILFDEGTSPVPPISWTSVVISGVFFFLFELSYEVIYDLRDAPGDARANVRSYPVVHGERGAVRIIDALTITSMIVLAGGFFTGLVPWRLFIMIAAPIIQLVYYKRALRRGITSADCIRLTWIGAALLATYNVWIEAGLPK